MNINLLTEFYLDADSQRREELSTCLFKNVFNSRIKSVNLVVSDEQTEQYLMQIPKNIDSDLNVIRVEKRPTYNDLFAITQTFDDSGINIISNTDIVFDYEFVDSIRNFDFKAKDILALSRWDYTNTELTCATHYKRADSQDCWIKKGAFPQMKDANFTLGIAGCDNRIAAIMFESGFNVLNPSCSIKTYHLHLSGKRNYISNGKIVNRINGKYLLVNPF